MELLKNNPREIRDGQFNSLVESMERDPEFMGLRQIVVWQVPENLDAYGDDDVKCPFKGQEGKMVIIGGNQRAKALMVKGEKGIPDEWVVEAKDGDGNWLSVEQAMRFVLVDNSQEGNSGYNDYEKLAEFFDEASMRLSGVDFSEFMTSDDPKMQGVLGGAGEGDGDGDGEGGSAEDGLEAGEHGEKSEDLEAFIAEREKTRRDLKEIDDTGFHLCMIFDTKENKAEFVSGSGLMGSGGKVMGNGTTYVDLVFESYRQKMDFAEKAGLLEEDDEGDPRLLYGMFCDGRYIAEKMGIQLTPSGLHFRDRRLDTRLAAMAREEAPQKTPEEIAEEQFAKVKAEREELGMPTGRGGKGKKGKKGRSGGGSGIVVDGMDGEVQYGDDLPPEDVDM